MKWLCLVTWGLLCMAATAGAAERAGAGAGGAGASLAQIVAGNASAHGGEARWRAMGSLSLSGELDAGGRKPLMLPYVMTLKRPNKSRFEVRFNGRTAYQVYDGSEGWKVKPFLNRNETEPYSADELRVAAESADIESPLIAATHDGTSIALAGLEAIEGHNAYHLVLTLKDGAQRNLWVDAASFLEVRMDGEPRTLDGKPHRVSLFFRDYRSEGGLTMAHTVETVVEGVRPSHKLTIKEVKLNPPVEDALFARPALPVAQVATR
jgi:hypothetical protein